MRFDAVEFLRSLTEVESGVTTETALLEPLATDDDDAEGAPNAAEPTSQVRADQPGFPR